MIPHADKKIPEEDSRNRAIPGNPERKPLSCMYEGTKYQWVETGTVWTW
jgi:hypothetical protein